MSVILTATKKAVKPKSAKPKKKRQHHTKQNGASTSSTPPMSTDRTKVWHWDLEGEPITVMYNKDKNEVWCNGEVMDTMSCFSPDGDGGLQEFYIITDDNNVHKGRIKRIATGDRREPMLYQLYVNGYMIMEHNTAPPCSGRGQFSPFEPEFPMFGASAAQSPFGTSAAPPPPFGRSAGQPSPFGGPYAAPPFEPPPSYYDPHYKKDN